MDETTVKAMKTTLSLALIVASSVTFGVSAATPPSLSITNILASVRVEANGVDPGKWVVVERSTNLVDWVEVRSYRPVSSVYGWTEARRSGAAFYRLIQDPGPQSRVAASTYQAMQSSGVPGVSMAVITHGQISWASQLL